MLLIRWYVPGFVNDGEEPPNLLVPSWGEALRASRLADWVKHGAEFSLDRRREDFPLVATTPDGIFHVVGYLDQDVPELPDFQQPRVPPPK